MIANPTVTPIAVTEPEEAEEFVTPAEEEDDDRQIFVGFVLDQSGSMDHLQSATIDGFNEYLNTLKEKASDVIFSLTQFDSDSSGQARLQRVVEFINVQEVQPLTDEIYKPWGGTPLCDAVADTIHNTQAKIDELKVDAKVLCVIQTDGMENASKEYTRQTVRELIDTKTKDGWTFVYLGAGEGTWDQASGFGISAGNIGTYSSSRIGTQRAFRGAAVASANYAATRGVQTQSLYADAGVDQDMTDSNVPDVEPETKDEEKESDE